MRRRLPALVLAALLLGGLALPVSAVEVGEKAPDFALPGTPDKPVRLSQYAGKRVVVLHFYLGDFLRA
ncbi:MAG: redoxin domain-containing protein [Candidatus Rokubacteria bacterium]|nr:redoxin domain-containing protein [Candidatus Rokubacteria bacterium]